MKLTVSYSRVAIPVRAFEDAVERARPAVRAKAEEVLAAGSFPSFDQAQVEKLVRDPFMHQSMGVVHTSRGEWSGLKLDEIFTRMREPFTRARFDFSNRVFNPVSQDIIVTPSTLRIEIDGDDERSILDWAEYWDRVAEDHAMDPVEARPRVFIGHGGSGEWQKTERWLRTLEIDVMAWETLPHSGRTIERVLTEALDWANFALLVMTAEDERDDQTMQARQNVVHELGLFQGRLGWDQALILLEDGTSEFSNIAGTNQLRFPASTIEAKHGDVIVALRERFPGIVLSR